MRFKVGQIVAQSQHSAQWYKVINVGEKNGKWIMELEDIESPFCKYDESQMDWHLVNEERIEMRMKVYASAMHMLASRVK